MKIRQSQTSASYLLPDPGELNRRITLRRRADVPADDFDVESTYTEKFDVWAKVAQPGAAAYQGSVQTENIVTHYFTIRFRHEITADHEVVYYGQVYRIRRIRDLNSQRRFLLLECEELRTERRRGECCEPDSLFTRRL
jgi:SPP1 family predicted phage head-tail adaptor